MSEKVEVRNYMRLYTVHYILLNVCFSTLNNEGYIHYCLKSY